MSLKHVSVLPGQTVMEEYGVFPPEQAVVKKSGPFAVLLLLVTVGCSRTPEEEYLLGLKYTHGENVPRDDVEAVKWYRKAAIRGHAEAQHKLGYAYNAGAGVSRDHAEALKWCRMAAEQGYAPAQYNLGIEYDDGISGEVNDVEAYAWLRLFLDSRSHRPDELIAHCRERIAVLDESLTRQQLEEVHRLTGQLRRTINASRRKSP